MLTEPSLLAQGFTLLVMGMGFVFLFLTLLVIATSYMSKLILRFSPVTASTASTLPTAINANKQPSPQIISAIAAALHLHKNKHN